MGKIIVIGSSNTDLIAKVKEFPKEGETIEGVSFLQVMGGKGANQALAAHRLGGDVKFITSLGKDANGLDYFEYLKNEGLDTSLSFASDEAPSGIAMIWVNERGENSIVIYSGANNMLSPAYIHKIEKEILDADIIVLQMEIPYNTVKAVCEIAYKNRIRILLNVAPARTLDTDLMRKVDILVVNETEAEKISGEFLKDVGEIGILDKLSALGANTIVLTLGEKGCMLKNNQQYINISAFMVDAIDTTAAGDTFCGALAAQISKGVNWKEALEFASAAAAICVTCMGAQPSIPTEIEVYDLLKKNSVNY